MTSLFQCWGPDGCFLVDMRVSSHPCESGLWADSSAQWNVPVVQVMSAWVPIVQWNVPGTGDTLAQWPRHEIPPGESF